MQLCVLHSALWGCKPWDGGNRWKGSRKIWTRPGCTVQLTHGFVWKLVISALVVSWMAFRWQLKEPVLDKWECPVSQTGQCLTVCWKTRYPNETGLCLPKSRHSISGSGPWDWWSQSLSLFSVPVQKSFWHLASFQLSPFSISALAFPSFTPCSYFFFLTLQFLQDPALFTPLPHRQPSVSLSLTPSSHTQCSISQAFGQGAPLSPSKTHCCDCLLLMSASPHHLGKEGKIHKWNGKYISFSFYSTFILRRLRGVGVGFLPFSISHRFYFKTV